MTSHVPTKNDFWFLPLGGSGEIGMNMNLYGHNGQWIIVDMGINFNDRLGIDIVTPDPTFIEDHKDRLQGIVITHAHEDHIGAIPHLWKFLECPVYATPFTAEIIKRKLSEHPWGKKVPIHIIDLNSKFELGAFEIEYIHLTHSILEPNALCIRTPLGSVMHSGDWKIDPSPQVGLLTNEDRIKELANDNILALVCDSTNAFDDGESGSEEMVFENLEQIIASESKNRVVVSCFSSNIARVQTIARIAEKAGRRICLVGRSLINMVSAAKETGYLKDFPTPIDDQTAIKMPRHKVLFITTGSQGESRAALSRIANNQHSVVKLEPDDLVIFSSRIIPGNEKIIGHLQNNLVKNGCRIVVDNQNTRVHVSGHPAKEELKKMYDWLKPNLLIPTHGEYRHMAEQARWGRVCGIKETFIPLNGMIIDLLKGHSRLVDKVETGKLGVDGNSLVAMDSYLIKDRTRMSIHGVLFATIYHTSDGYLTRAPMISIIGLTDDSAEHAEIISEIEPIIRSQMNVTYSSKSECHKAIESALRSYMFKNFEKKPLMCLHLVKEQG
ncbi:MAG: ribonuclease J [Proteobacteria bacterium]|nr:ribonuclease J [Pseudomonadota bacterium]